MNDELNKSPPAHTPAPWHEEGLGKSGNILITDEQGVTVATCWKQPLPPVLLQAAPPMVPPPAAASMFPHELTDHRCGRRGPTPSSVRLLHRGIQCGLQFEKIIRSHGSLHRFSMAE